MSPIRATSSGATVGKETSAAAILTLPQSRSPFGIISSERCHLTPSRFALAISATRDVHGQRVELIGAPATAPYISFPTSIMDEQNTVTITFVGKPWTMCVRTCRYAQGGNLAVELVGARDGSPFATLSINVAGLSLAYDEFVFKTYSENEGLLEEMLRTGVVALTGRSVEIGPICRLLKDYGRTKEDLRSA